jgi:hypothetical protein
MKSGIKNPAGTVLEMHKINFKHFLIFLRLPVRSACPLKVTLLFWNPLLLFVTHKKLEQFRKYGQYRRRFQQPYYINYGAPGDF